MKYFLYADIYRAKVPDSQIRKYFEMAMEDIGLDPEENCMYLSKHNGEEGSITNPNSITIKREIFGAENGRGYLYTFYVDEKLSDSKMALLKNSLVMNIMGVVDVKSEDCLKDYHFLVRNTTKMIKMNEYIIQDLDNIYPTLKFMDFEEECNARKIVSQLNLLRNGSIPYDIHGKIKMYYCVKKAELDLYNLLCENT